MSDENKQLSDISQLDVAAGAEKGMDLQLKHPATGKPIHAWLHILGADSKAYKAKQTELLRRFAEKKSKDRDYQRPEEEASLEACEQLAAVTTAGRIYLGPEEGEYVHSFDAAVKLYRRYAWIAEQVDNAIYNRANFLPASGIS